MADSETSFLSEACNSKADNAKTQSASKRPSDAFSIEKLLSVTSSDICFRIAGRDEQVGVTGGSPFMNFNRRIVQNYGEEEREGLYNRNSAVTSIVSADSSSVGLPAGYCGEELYEDEDEEVLLDEDMEDLALQSPAEAAESVSVADRAEVVSTTLTGEADPESNSSISGEQKGE